MKIVFLVSSFPSVSERFISNQIIGLINQGIEVRILSMNRARSKEYHQDIANYGLTEKTFCVGIPRNPGMRLIKMIGLVLKWLLYSPRKLRRALSQRIYNRAASTGKNLFVMDYLRQNPLDCDLLHCHFGPNGVVGSFLYDIAEVPKYIVTYHGSDINTYPLKYGRDVYSHVFATAQGITCNTTFTADKVASYGADRNKISILPVGLHMKEYPNLKHDSALSTQGIQLLTVARLAEKKGHTWTLKALAQLKDEYPILTYHVIGDGPLKEALAQEADKLGIKENVIFHGVLMKEKIMPLYAECDIFILSSITAANGDMEGQGLVLQEAQAVGLPVVSTLHNGIPDGVIEGKTGYLVPEKDADTLAQRLKDLIENPAQRYKMGQAGRSFVQQNYDIPVLSRQLIDIYKKIV